MSQIDKRFTSDEVKELFERYLQNEIERKYIQEILGIKKSRFFMLLKEYKEDPQHFTIQYKRTTPPRISLQRLNTISSKNSPSKRKSSRTKRSL